MGYEKNISIHEDDNKVKKWVGEFSDHKNSFYKEIFENRLLDCIKE